LFVLALIAATAASAVAQKITTEFDESVDFTRFKTFAISEDDVRSQSPALNSELTQKRVEGEVERALTARGLEKSAQPDLDVIFSLGSDPGTKTERLPARWRGRGRAVRVPNMAGTLVIDLRDAETRSLVWRGVAMEDERDPVKLATRLDDMVRRTIARYPPKK
jgi:hypothetical protein